MQDTDNYVMNNINYIKVMILR